MTADFGVAAAPFVFLACRRPWQTTRCPTAAFPRLHRRRRWHGKRRGKGGGGGVLRLAHAGHRTGAPDGRIHVVRLLGVRWPPFPLRHPKKILRGGQRGTFTSPSTTTLLWGCGRDDEDGGRGGGQSTGRKRGEGRETLPPPPIASPFPMDHPTGGCLAGSAGHS